MLALMGNKDRTSSGDKQDGGILVENLVTEDHI